MLLQMWSHLYWYFKIQKNHLYYEEIVTKMVREVLLETGCLVQNDLQTFKNKENFPWIYIAIVKSDQGNFRIPSDSVETVNLISIVGSKYEIEYEQKYKSLLVKIASKLNWKAFLEEDDEGNEDVEIS